MPKQRRKFFVIDDDDAVRSAVCLLVRSFGWEVSSFASAAGCLLALQNERPDCPLLDLNMPGMNGVQLLETLSEQSIAIPVVAMTGHIESSLSKQAEPLAPWRCWQSHSGRKLSKPPSPGSIDDWP